MTGEWAENEDAEKLLKLDDEDEDLYGDFEDLETGEKVQAKEATASQTKEDKAGKAGSILRP